MYHFNCFEVYGSVASSTFTRLCTNVALSKNFCSKVRAKYWSDFNNTWDKELVKMQNVFGS